MQKQNKPILDNSPGSKKFFKRELQMYEKLWKSKESNIRRNISQVVTQKCREEWKMPILIKEAKAEIIEEK